MSKHELPDPVFIDRYLAGETGTPESEELVRLLGEREDVQACFDGSVGGVDLEADWKTLDSRISDLEGRAGAVAGLAEAQGQVVAEGKLYKRSSSKDLPFFAFKKGGVSSRVSLQKWVRYGAAAFGIVLLALVGAKVARLSPPNQVNSQVSQFKEYTTAPGQRATITLKDGTQIMLNVASRIRVAGDYDTKAAVARVIDLIGEAQFIVTHDPKRPFIVRANGTLVRDLATTFVVRAYPGASTTRLAVRDGRVSVQPPAIVVSDAVAIEAGRAAVISSSSNIAVNAISNNSEYFGWTNGRLVLNKVPLAEALAELGRWYGMDFRVADSSMLSVHDISGEYPQTLTSEGLRAIAEIIGTSAQRSGTTVVLYPIKP